MRSEPFSIFKPEGYDEIFYWFQMEKVLKRTKRKTNMLNATAKLFVRVFTCKEGVQGREGKTARVLDLDAGYR
jgi:hypothetical protein